jgi:hypothetical protein
VILSQFSPEVLFAESSGVIGTVFLSDMAEGVHPAIELKLGPKGLEACYPDFFLNEDGSGSVVAKDRSAFIHLVRIGLTEGVEETPPCTADKVIHH